MSVLDSASNFVDSELANCLKEYDYGIKQNSVKVSKQEPGVFELVLLENVQLVIRVTQHGFLIVKATPLEDAATADAERIKVLNKPFETMESLLQASSAKFAERFYQALYAKLAAIDESE
ncbi:9892_t:CDS:2 [Paraglomus occultum]|uniref:9892_t:CDS:1 n=1 Tax=Paraglomus occultum TaxID=144539 RepID=A0A9N9BK53_9GLOM|nr:9892_t:CDS:2 [Paraglomus occultum]